MAKKENKDDLVAKLQKVVKDKKAEIAQIERPNYYTNLSFPGIRGAVNLNTVNDLNQLAFILGELLSSRDSFDAAALKLGLNTTFKVGGFTYDEWEHDIKAKTAKIQVNSKKQELELLEKRLAALESPELKAKRELEDIQKELGIS